jgi:hypothetical protein
MINSNSDSATNASNNIFLWQILITSFVGIFITNFNYLFTALIKKTFGMLSNINFSFFRKKPKSSITVSSIHLESEYGVKNRSSENYRAILYKIHDLDINIKKIKEKNVEIQVFEWRTNSSARDNIFNYDIDHSDEIIILPELDIRIKTQITSKNNIFDNNNARQNNYSINYKNIILYSNKLSINELLDILQLWRREYNDYLKQYVDDNKLYYYSLITSNEINEIQDSKKKGDGSKNIIDDKTKWRINEFKSNKTFENTFFMQKKVLLDKLYYFINNEKIYVDRGIPYNLGLLFHGPPGCGKTSCIKSIANLTRRHVMEISLNKVKTCGDFIDIIYNDFIDKAYVPVNKRILVIEDIDCMLDIVMDRELQDSDKEDISVDDLLKISLLDKMAPYKPYYRNEDKLTLSCILNTIDGVLEQHGRILIISSNYPDKLDRALLRPGRIDSKINFGNCNHAITKEIIEFFYQRIVSDDIVFPDNKYTPAEVINLCISDDNVFEKTIDRLLQNDETKE